MDFEYTLNGHWIDIEQTMNIKFESISRSWVWESELVREPLEGKQHIINRILNVQFIDIECILNIHYTLKIYWMNIECTLNTQWNWSGCSFLSLSRNDF